MRGRRKRLLQDPADKLPGVGPPPDHLPAAARQLWLRIVELWGEHLREIDRSALERFCTAALLARKAASFLLHGASATDKGMTFNKAVSLWRSSSEEMRKAEEQLGLSPQARARLAKFLPQDKDVSAILDFLKPGAPTPSQSPGRKRREK